MTYPPKDYYNSPEERRECRRHLLYAIVVLAVFLFLTALGI